jgi:hypothetical protein
VDLVAMAEDEGGHLGVPEARLVAKVHTGFQHLTHGHGHDVFLKVGSKIRPEIEAVNSPATTPLIGWIRDYVLLTGSTPRAPPGKTQKL